MSWWYCFPPSTMVLFQCHCFYCFFCFFFGFLIAHECDHSFGSLITSELLCWSDHIFAIYPPLEAWFWTHPLKWRRRCRWQTIFQRHFTSIPSYCHWRTNHQKMSNIIIWRRRDDSTRRWEHPRDLASTSLWPSMVRLSSMPQQICDRGISPIHSSGRTKVSAVEGNSESAAILTGR